MPKPTLDESLQRLVTASMNYEKRRVIETVVKQIESNTGPTGGWLDSPKAVCAAIVAALEALEDVRC